MEKEGMDIVAGVRDRYNGENRNPWNEMECGSNYARSMAAYALLPAYSGFSFDMTKAAMGFAPLRDGSYFWSLDKAWGIFEQQGPRYALKVLYGEQRLRRFTLGGSKVKSVLLDGEPVAFSAQGETVVFEKPLTIKAGERLLFE
jgi:hypothetical protein